MERIAVGLSDPASQKALDWVLARAMTRQVSVTLIAAYDWFLTPREQVMSLLNAARERIAIRSARTVVHLAAVEDNAIRTLVDESTRSDLLVIGSHLRRRMAPFAESPSITIARRAQCATVIVPEGWMPTTHGVVVVGADDDSSSSAIDFAAAEVEQSGAHLEIVRAWTAPLPAYDPQAWVVDSEAQLRVTNRQKLDELVARVEAQHPAVHVGGLLSESLAGVALRQRASRADLVVIGSHRRGPIAAFLVGSTAHAMLGSTGVPLCIVPNNAPADDRRTRQLSSGRLSS
jgi:nucleotide-binding universal stress UspA family protein